MKNTSLILNVITLVAVAVVAFFAFKGKGNDSPETNGEGTAAGPKSGSIVYFNLDRVIEEYDMANDLRSVVDSKAQGIQDEVNRRGSKLQSDINSFQEKLNKGLITRSTAEVQGQKLDQQRNDFADFTNRKNQEIAEEQQVMLNNIGDAIKKFLDQYAADNNYSMVLATQGDILPAPVAAADSSLDVTDDIIIKLNDQYVKEKSKKDSK